MPIRGMMKITLSVILAFAMVTSSAFANSDEGVWIEPAPVTIRTPTCVIPPPGSTVFPEEMPGYCNLTGLNAQTLSPVALAGALDMAQNDPVQFAHVAEQLVSGMQGKSPSLDEVGDSLCKFAFHIGPQGSAMAVYEAGTCSNRATERYYQCIDRAALLPYGPGTGTSHWGLHDYEEACRMELVANLGICFGISVEGILDPFVSGTINLIGDLTQSHAIKHFNLDVWFGMDSYNPDFYNPNPDLPYCPGFGPPQAPSVALD